MKNKIPPSTGAVRAAFQFWSGIGFCQRKCTKQQFKQQRPKVENTLTSFIYSSFSLVLRLMLLNTSAKFIIPIDFSLS
jgi:hypothetical protein